MIKNELAPGIIVYKNVIEGYESLITDIEDSTALGAISWLEAGVKSGKDQGVYKSQRDTLTIPVSYKFFESKEKEDNVVNMFHSTLSQLFYNYFNPCEQDYQNTYGIATDWHDQYGILKYGVGQKFVNHIDDHIDFHRRISTVYYLNSDYTGGEILFPRFNISYKPEANDMIIFPSTYVYNHSVNEVTEGTRYAVVSWLR